MAWTLQLERHGGDFWSPWTGLKAITQRLGVDFFRQKLNNFR